jgi:thiamine kinase
MAASLPGNVRLKLEQTLGQWRSWDCTARLTRKPVVQRELGAGFSNYNVLVGVDDARWVVRLDGINPVANGLNRQGEWRSLQAAHDAGIAPRPCYFNPELGSLVCSYLPPDTRHPDDPTSVGELMRRIHRLPARHQRLDLAERILVYEKRLAHRSHPLLAELSRRSEAVAAQLTEARRGDTARVHCHNDLLRANRIWCEDRLWAIDWEYSAMGSPWYDLAVVIAGDALDAQAGDALLLGYLGRSPTAPQRRWLRQYSVVYRYLELLWYLALDRRVLSQQQLRRRLELLDAALTANP